MYFYSPTGSSVNAYDQASESLHSPPCVVPRRRPAKATGERCGGHETASVSGSCSSGGVGGAGGGANSLKTSVGGINTGAAAYHMGPPTSAPWYQPHIPRELALEMLSRQPVS